jgi:transcriptional regulator with XRE-family HTH domain
MTALAVLRRRKLWTQRQLADHAEVAPSTVYVLEAGRRSRPRFEVMQRIAAALQVDVDEVDEFRRVIEGGSEQDLKRAA